MFQVTRLYTCIALAWILSFFIARGAAANVDCDPVADLEPNTVWRGDAWLDNPTFRWTLPSQGIATLHLLKTGPGSPWIDFRTDACGGEAADVWVIEQSPRHLILAVRSAGNVYLTTGSKTSTFRLVTSFTRAEVVEASLDLGDRGMLAVQTSFLRVDSSQKTEPEILDPDPSGLIFPPGRLKTEPEILDPDPSGLIFPLGRLKTEPEILDPDPSGLTFPPGRLKTEPEILDPDPSGLTVENRHFLASFLSLDSSAELKTEPEILDPDPSGWVAGGIRGRRSAFRYVLHSEVPCRRTESDDHGDTASCATPLALGGDVTGELANDWHDDRDVFSFRVDLVSTVEIMGVSEVPGVTLELSGPAGQHLAMDRSSTGETRAHLVATLVPGRYFLHVTGESGAFAITARIAD